MPDPVWVIGECPSRTATDTRPLRGVRGSGARLAQWAGVTPDAFHARVQCLNLFADYQPAWSTPQARARAQECWRQVEQSLVPVAEGGTGLVRVLLLGARVRDAFGLNAHPPFVSFHVLGADLAWMPHPSGRCRYWNNPRHVQMVEVFLRRLMEKGHGQAQ